MSIHLLLEAALRSLIMGAIILASLHIMRIAQVRARRTAWLLALLGALAMPVLVGAQIGPRLLPEITLAKAPEALESAPWIPREQFIEIPAQVQVAVASREQITKVQRARVPLLQTLTSVAEVGYGSIAGVLLLRLCIGLSFAFRLRNAARRLHQDRVALDRVALDRVALDPVGPYRVIAQFDPALDVRSSARITTPVTIGSSVLLPEGYPAWDETTLRIVLSHERAHVRQGDFYVHALAEMHCALFWFNPFSWWLRRELSELGEALSDRAAVEHADSRAGYAEILLAFATRGRRPLAGVAMASVSNLTPRIERLLSEKHFERSFSGKQRLPLAAGVVILALFAATATVKVHAVPNAGFEKSDAPAVLDVLAGPAAPAAPDPPAAAQVPAAPEVPAAPTPMKPESLKKTQPLKRPTAPRRPETPQGSQEEQEGQEGMLGLHTGHSRIIIDSGKDLPPLSGDYIYFQHDGKPYLIQDPSVIAEAQRLLAPMQELADKQKELGAQRALLGAKQRVLNAQRFASIETAEMKIDTAKFKRDMAELQSLIKQMDLGELNVKIDPQALAAVQTHIAEIQAATARLQAGLGDHLRGFGEQQGKLGEQQGKLGEEQRALAEQRRQVVEALRRQLQPIIEQAIREGKGKQLAE
ncbi:MAG TPA: M56 family metallopeptidase [Steroidobacteraceae bacterium]